MSKKSKKKVVLDEKGEKPKEDLLFWADSLETVTIYGRKMKRIRYDGTTDCTGCHTKPGHLHLTHCPREYCSHCKGWSIDCLCDPDILNAERDHFVECILRGNEDAVG